jgi:hypothetical protein
MKKTVFIALLLAATLLAPPLSSAEVFMCVDPDSGKKTFTDKACPTVGERKKVKVQPTNFGQGSKPAHGQGTWSSDRDTSISGTDNLDSHSRRVEEARTAGNTH